MGFFSKFVSAVTSGVKKAVAFVKEKAIDAIDWLANKAETFVGEVKQLYKAAKPYISKARIVLRTITANVPIPWVQAAGLAVDKALAVIEHLDSNPLAAKLQQAIDWLIARARELHSHLLNEQEVAEARQRAQDLKAAMEKVGEEERKVLEGLALVNRYELIRVQIDRLIQDEAFVDFEHYLRIRAVQKLLPLYQEQMKNLKQVTDVLGEPLFIINTAEVLIEAHAELDNFSLQQLDRLTTERFGKPVIPFVFEEMIAVWGLDQQQHQATWEKLSEEVARNRVIVRRLASEAEFGELSVEEAKVLADLRMLEDTDKKRLEKLGEQVRAKRNYVFAAEGFLQLLESDEQRLIDQDREYLMDDGIDVGSILIRCAQNGEKWESLTHEEQSLIISFANIFETDCRRRTASLLTVEVAA